MDLFLYNINIEFLCELYTCNAYIEKKKLISVILSVRMQNVSIVSLEVCLKHTKGEKYIY